jgi:hypothetical protein
MSPSVHPPAKSFSTSTPSERGCWCEMARPLRTPATTSAGSGCGMVDRGTGAHHRAMVIQGSIRSERPLASRSTRTATAINPTLPHAITGLYSALLWWIACRHRTRRKFESCSRRLRGAQREGVRQSSPLAGPRARRARKIGATQAGGAGVEQSGRSCPHQQAGRAPINHLFPVLF